VRLTRGGEAGFTLLEMLVAMMLFSLILSFFGALFHRLGTTNATISRIERSENVDVVRRYLLQSLEGSRAHSRLDAKGVRTVQFRGEPSRVTFVGIAAGDRETGGLYETEVWLDTEGRLLLQRRPLGREQDIELTPEVLLEHLASFTFTYSPCPLEPNGADLHRWTNTRHLPFVISVTATFETGDVRDWRKMNAFVAASACRIGM
jgi:prepilin-type N-terminal cleavage/methylation domain-containing protein